jgi:hypothetical protein
MNSLIVGAGDKTDAILSRLDAPYLLIDDGPIIDCIKRKPFNTTRHSFDILKGMDYRRARDFISVLDAVFPEGANTLTRKNSNFLILQALLDKPAKLQSLIEPDEKDPASLDAYQKIQTLLLSPVLKGVLTKPTNVRFGDVVLARLDRAALGDFDSFVLGHFLISLYPGQVVIPDFGFYGREYLTYLIRQDRLICGVRTLSELSPALRQTLLLIPDKGGQQCTYEDAITLADYEGWEPTTMEYKAIVKRLITCENR